MKTSTKIIVTIEAIFVIGVLVYVFLAGNPRQLTPFSGAVIKENFTFEFDNAKEIVLSTNENFTPSFKLKKEEKITLPPGTYYWKTKKWFRESEIRNFTIPSKIILSLEEKNESYVLENKGNVDLNVTKRSQKGLITGMMVLDIEESAEIEKENSTILEGKRK